MSQTEQWVGKMRRDEGSNGRHRNMAEEKVKEMGISVNFRRGACLNFHTIYFIMPWVSFAKIQIFLTSRAGSYLQRLSLWIQTGSPKPIFRSHVNLSNHC